MTESPWLAPLCIGTQLCGAAEVADLAPELARAGYRALELHPAQLSAMGDRAFRRRLVESFHSAGLSVACVFVGVASDAPSTALVSARCEMAAVLGAEVVFLVPASRKSATFEELAAQVRKVCRRAGEVGVEVAVHNHAGTHVTTAAAQLRFLEEVDRPEAGICLDLAHLALFEDDVPAAIDRLAPYVRYLHVKDLEVGAREALERLDGNSLEGVAALKPAYTDIGAGSLDLKSALQTLAQHGYRRWATIEIETLRRPTFLEQAQDNAEQFALLLAPNQAVRA
ncbi:MAG: sugar phosphate isomerase/epimerase [Acidimicrobiales bacterium]